MTPPVGGYRPPPGHLHRRHRRPSRSRDHSRHVRQHRRRLRRRDRPARRSQRPPGRRGRVRQVGRARRSRARSGRVRRPRGACVAFRGAAPQPAARKDRRRRLSEGAAGRADLGTGAGSGGLRPARGRDRGSARTPQKPCGCSHFDGSPRRGPDHPSWRRDTRPARHDRQDRSPTAPPRADRPCHMHDPSGQISARLAPELHRPGPWCPQRDPPPRTSHRRAARHPRHHPARQARHRPHRRSHTAVRSRRPHTFRPRDPSSHAGAAPAPSRSPQAKAAATPSSTGSTSQATGASTQCCTSRQSPSSAPSPKPSPTSPKKPAKAKPDAKPDEPTNASSPTASSAECGATKPPENNHSRSPLDKGASDRPISLQRRGLAHSVRRPET